MVPTSNNGNFNNVAAVKDCAKKPNGVDSAIQQSAARGSVLQTLPIPQSPVGLSSESVVDSLAARMFIFGNGAMGNQRTTTRRTLGYGNSLDSQKRATNSVVDFPILDRRGEKTAVGQMMVGNEGK